MSKPLVIYHGNCADGFGAAWAFHQWGRYNEIEIEFYPGVYDQAPPNVAGRDVVMVDFSYKLPVLEQMAQAARSIVILDHHKSALDLTDFLGPIMSSDVWRREVLQSADNSNRLLYKGAWFDMERSGAVLAWEWLFPGSAYPRVLSHIEDRDLWRFQLEGTAEIMAAVFSYPYDFKVWDRFMRMAVDDLAAEGVTILRKHHKDIDELLTVVTRRMRIGGCVVPVANLPYTMVSDAAHKLAIGQPFAACYWDTPEGRVFGLRSTEDGLDVCEIAKMYGGGGHEHSAGFTVPLDHGDPIEIDPK